MATIFRCGRAKIMENLFTGKEKLVDHKRGLAA